MHRLGLAIHLKLAIMRRRCPLLAKPLGSGVG